MREVFENATGDIVIFTDNGITFKNSIYSKYYPYGSILKIRISLGCLEVMDKEKAENGKNKANIFSINRENKNRINELIKFAEKQIATAKPAKAVRKKIEDDETSLPKDIEDEIMLATQNKPTEYRKRCNVCGKIFCYTEDDLKDSKHNSNMAALSAFGALASVLGGTAYQTFENKKQSDKYSDKVVDYNKCPNCNSTNLSILSEEEFEAMQTPKSEAASTATSAVDELKKFKELLDMGIITQEEFDAKKKQLLGL